MVFALFEGHHAARVMAAFAEGSGLVYLGSMQADDDYQPVPGFTAQAGQTDSFVAHGNVHGFPVTMLQRTVRHTTGTRTGKRHDRHWLIAAVELPSLPGDVLLLSQAHPLATEEATFIHHARSQHVALEYQLDVQFLVYARPADVQDIQQATTPQAVATMLANTTFDYEFDGRYLFVYSTEDVNSVTLQRLLNTALALAAEYSQPAEN